jgi:beta-N-acetylhexosaminidase
VVRDRDGGWVHGAAQRRRPLAACLISLLMACSGCGIMSGGRSPQASTTPAAPATPKPGSGMSATSKAPPSCPAEILSRMSEAQRVGQLFLVGIAGEPVADIAQAVGTYHFGSLLFGSDSTASTAQIRQMSRAVQALASAEATAKVRFFIAANQEGGQVQQLQGPGFAAIPSALDQGRLSARELQRDAAAWGRELRSAGVNLDLAPVMDVVPPGTASQNQPVGALQREFGFSPAAVGTHGTAFIRGMRQAGVATAAKHFPGLGRVAGNTDFTSGVIDTTTGPKNPYLKSFQAAIKAGVPFVMVALATYTRLDPRHLAAFSSRIMQGLLRTQMHFRGVIVSDDLGAAAAVAGISTDARGIDFLAAGGDLITSEGLAAAEVMDRAVLQRAAAEPAFRATVNAAALRVLDAKQAYHLMPCR